MSRSDNTEPPGATIGHNAAAGVKRELRALRIDHEVTPGLDDGGYRLDVTVPAEQMPAALVWHALNRSRGPFRIFVSPRAS